MNSHLENHLPGAEECNLNLRLHFNHWCVPNSRLESSILEQNWKTEDGKPRMTNPGHRCFWSPNSSPKYQTIVSKEHKVTYQALSRQKRAKLPQGERLQKVGWQEHRSYRCICPLTPLPVVVVAILSSPSSKYINHHHHSILVLSRGHIYLHVQCTLHYFTHKSSPMLMQEEAVPA